MRPVSVSANGLDEAERLRAELRGRWRLAVRAVMVLLSLQGLPAAQIAGAGGSLRGFVHSAVMDHQTAVAQNRAALEATIRRGSSSPACTSRWLT
jgi:hypothetical protein